MMVIRTARVRGTAILAAALLLLPGIAARLAAQVPGGCNQPVRQRQGEMGCFLVASVPVDSLPAGAVFWHVYNYSTRQAAESARRASGTVVESFGRVWLYTIADSSWRPASGTRVAVIGPLPVDHHARYTARYLETVTIRGMQSLIHRHAGPEAWYMLSGTQCLETPGGTRVARAGQSAFVPGGTPMLLSTVGSQTRRAVVLVLHDRTQPWMTQASDWTPKGLCGR